jgi:hypothetical protein
MDEQHSRCADEEAKDGYILSGYTFSSTITSTRGCENANNYQAKVSNE